MASYAYDPVALIKNWQEQHSNYLANTDPDVLKSRQMYSQNHVYDLGNGYFGAGSDPNGPINIARSGFQVGDKYQLWSPDGNGGYTPEDKTKVARTGWMSKVGNLVQAVTPALVGSMTAGAFGVGPFSPGGAFSSPTGWVSAEGGAGYAGGTAADASSGIWGTGLSTGSNFGDWLAKQAVTTGIKSAILPSLFGGSGGTRTGTGGSNMADGSNLLNLLLSGAVSNNNIDRITDVANGSADRISNLATNLQNQGTFTPYNIRSGVGSVTTGADGSMQATLDPKYQDNSDLALSQSNHWLNQRANPLYAANETKGLFGAGQLMDKAAAFDPEAAAKEQYGLMQQIYAPTRENDNLNMENRLLQQGRLGLNYGSYGAAPELMALKEAQRRQDLDATLQSRQTAFDRQNQIINQAGALNDIGIKSGAAGTQQQQAYYNMANGLLNMSLRPQEMLNQQTGQAINAGANRANAEQAKARLFGDMNLNAERMRTQGASIAAALKNERDKNLLSGVVGGSGGFLSGAGNAISGIAKQLLSAGIPPESLTKVMQDMGVEIDPGMTYEDFADNLDNLQFSDAGDWTGAGDMDADWLTW